MKNNLEKLSTMLGKTLAARGLASREYRIFGRWEKIVGAVIARHAQPQAVRGKKLSVVVDSPAWMQQLSLLKPELMEKLSRDLGKGAIEEVTLRLGEISVPHGTSIESRAPRSLDKEERLKIEHYVQGISDPETRESIRRVIEKDILRKKTP